LVFFELLQFASWPEAAGTGSGRFQAATPNVAAHLILALAVFAITAAVHRNRLTPRLGLQLALVTGAAPAALLPFAVLGAANLPAAAGWAAAQASASLLLQGLVYVLIRAGARPRLPIKHKAV
jgi:hypothetical protein